MFGGIFGVGPAWTVSERAKAKIVARVVGIVLRVVGIVLGVVGIVFRVVGIVVGVVGALAGGLGARCGVGRSLGGSWALAGGVATLSFRVWALAGSRCGEIWVETVLVFYIGIDLLEKRSYAEACGLANGFLCFVIVVLRYLC